MIIETLQRWGLWKRDLPIDSETGFPVGYHGEPQDAIDYALDGVRHDWDQGNQLAFLEAWQEGSAFEEWPEFYTWLRERSDGRK
jgi:hypothetical protein